MFRPYWVIFREKSFVIVTLRLHFIVEWECAVDCVLEAWTLCGPGLHYTAVQARTADSSRLQKQRSTQSTAHSHSTVNCNLSVTVAKSSPWRWPNRVETCRSVLRLMIKLSLCICWWLVFLYIVYFVYMIFCKISAKFYVFTSHFGFLYSTPDADRMVETCSVSVIIKYRMCQRECMELFAWICTHSSIDEVQLSLTFFSFITLS
jgi:hypothetical protein